MRKLRLREARGQQRGRHSQTPMPTGGAWWRGGAEEQPPLSVRAESLAGDGGQPRGEGRLVYGPGPLHPRDGGAPWGRSAGVRDKAQEAAVQGREVELREGQCLEVGTADRLSNPRTAYPEAWAANEAKESGLRGGDLRRGSHPIVGLERKSFANDNIHDSQS